MKESRVRAFIDNIIYHNPETYYSVLRASSEGEELTLVGHFPMVSEGEIIEAAGEYTSHPIYGEQFQVHSYTLSEPGEEDAIRRYLAGGFVKGIGPRLAGRIVDAFHLDALRVLEEEPERLAGLRGISRDMAYRFSEEIRARKGMRDALIFMQGCGIGTVLAGRIYEKYGPLTYTILKNNPYRLAEEVDGIGFRTADSIAVRMGLDTHDPMRIRAGILFSLMEAASDGHTYLPKELLRDRAEELLDLALGDMEEILSRLMIDGRVVVVSGEQGEQVYFAAYYYSEKNIASMLLALALKGESDEEEALARLTRVELASGVKLDPLQKEAVMASEHSGLLVITGGPGTGKTTIIRSLIAFYEEEGLEVALAAPTGRAAKRMSEATGHEAKTIHRLLEYTGIPERGQGPGTVASPEGTDRGLGGAPYAGGGNASGAGATSGKGRFLRDEKDPLEADVLIVDEASMVDIFLMEALLRAVTVGTRLVLVGDADQLPSVGAGNVLKDIIASGICPTVRLTHIHRQAAESDIVLNAHRINLGEEVDLSKKSNDFIFIRAQSAERVLDTVRSLITDKLPPYVGCDKSEIQVLSATRRGALGVERLNPILREYLNPRGPYDNEINAGETLLRPGDKVMQTRNNYDLCWTVYDERGLAAERGYGIFNGDIGRVEAVDTDADTITVVFDDAHEVVYERKDMRQLELAYALTVHKAQGSEYPAVVIIMARGPRPLMNRNLLYTAVTRAKKCVVLVGLPIVFEEMKSNEDENKRYSGLQDRLLETGREDF